MEWVDFTAKTVQDAITAALIKFETTSDKIEYEVIEKESSGLLGLFSKPAKIRVKLKLTMEDIAIDFLKKVFVTMKIDADINVKYNEEESSMFINMEGQDMGILIGKRGQTLDSLQYLTSLVVNKESDTYIKVKLDTENYRARRRETLENLAKNIAFKVRRTKQAVSLEPMNPYERRIIHSALQYDRYVETASEGEETNRIVVISLIKGYRDYSQKNSGYQGGKGYSKNYNKTGYQNKKYYKKNNSAEKETIEKEEI